jgi:hypothetical protein
MAFNYKVGLGNAASYQSSGTPWATGSVMCAGIPTVVGFPKVTRWVVVSNPTTGHVRVGFSSAGIDDTYGPNYFLTVPSGTVSPRLELKLTALYLSSSGGNTATVGIDVMAGLTGIDIGAINNPALSPSGSNWSGSFGSVRPTGI